jgi:hypothetical protein
MPSSEIGTQKSVLEESLTKMAREIDEAASVKHVF